MTAKDEQATQLKDVQIYENLLITEPNVIGPHGDDAITVFGEGHPECLAKKTIIRNCIIDFSKVPVEKQDEAISGVCGAVVDVENTIIIGSIKAMLCGNGDYPEIDRERGRWNLKNVYFLNCGRRCPEAQDGVRVSMEQCIIENWGQAYKGGSFLGWIRTMLRKWDDAFKERSFGSWAHHGAQIRAVDCIYIQEHIAPSFWFFLADFFSHLGQAWNDRPSRFLDYILPGSFRGASKSAGGLLFMSNCFATSPFTRLQGNKCSRDSYKAFRTAIHIAQALRSDPWMREQIRERCDGAWAL